MKIALNPPLRHLEFADYGDIFFAIVHYTIKNTDYAEFYKKRAESRCFLILDNGAYEKLPTVSPDRLVEQARFIKATEIIAPDVLQDPIATLNSTKSFLSILSKGERQKFRVMGVPQSRNKESWIHEYIKMIQLDIDTVGLPKWLGRRDVILKQLLYSGKFCHWKDHHLLGVKSINELKHIPKGVIRSIDTKLPIHLGANLLSLYTQKKPNELGYFNRQLNALQLQFALRNIIELKRVCQRL